MVTFVAPRPPHFPTELRADRHGLVALGGELGVTILTEAYGRGIFPWTGEQPIPWFCPDPRLVLLPQDFRPTHSLRKLVRSGRFEVRFDHDFDAVIRACAEIPRPGQSGTWITPNMIAAYTELFERGIGHCVGAYEEGELLGGLYGLSLGRAFFGESMFARAPNASKVALHALCDRLRAWDFAFIDCQQVTPHLVRLGAVTWSRRTFLARLHDAVAMPARPGPWA
jgi:leucyl/phenylalanyl-tRNA--protein transferase